MCEGTRKHRNGVGCERRFCLSPMQYSSDLKFQEDQIRVGCIGVHRKAPTYADTPTRNQANAMLPDLHLQRCQKESQGLNLSYISPEPLTLSL